MPALFENGFFVRRPAWHGLGVVLDEYPGREEAMKLAGHDFDMVEEPVYSVEDMDAAPTYAEIRGHKLLRVVSARREDDPKHGTVIGVVRDSYRPVQNSVCWDIIDAVVGLPNVNYETGATLDGGAQCFVTAWIDTPMTVPGDDSPIYPYAAVNWRHDGLGAVKLIRTSIREVCANTVLLAESEAMRTGFEYTFRHTKNVMARIEDAKAAILGIGDLTSAFMEIATELAALPINANQREYFISQMIPTPPDVLISDRVRANIDEGRGVIRNLITTSETVPDAHRDTGYGLMMAGTEYLDHLRGYRNMNTYLGRTLLRREPLKDALLPLIRETATL